MKKYNLSEIMKRAWEIKKENQNNIFSFCLMIAWEEAKKDSNVTQYLLSKGLKVWEKENNKRVYINDLEMFGLSQFTPNPKSMRGVTIYYNINEDKFYWNRIQKSNESVIIELIQSIRKAA